VSGVAASRTHDGVLWAVEDSGNAAALHAFALDGADLGTFTVGGTTNRDWEAVATAPGVVFVGDIGDNRGTLRSVVVHRVAEPPAAPAGSDGTVEVTATYTLRLPGGPADAEALLHDPVSGDLVVLTKNWDGDGSRILRAPADRLGSSGTVDLVDEGTVRLALPTFRLPGDALVTAADASPDGATLLVRTYGRVLAYRRAAGASVADSLRGDPCRAPSAPEEQGESIAFLPGGRGYVTVSEGASPGLHAFELVTPPPTSPRRESSRRWWPWAASGVALVAVALLVLRRMGDSRRARHRQG
jgi:hypothetical protein